MEVWNCWERGRGAQVQDSYSSNIKHELHRISLFALNKLLKHCCYLSWCLLLTILIALRLYPRASSTISPTCTRLNASGPPQ